LCVFLRKVEGTSFLRVLNPSCGPFGRLWDPKTKKKVLERCQKTAPETELRAGEKVAQGSARGALQQFQRHPHPALGVVGHTMTTSRVLKGTVADIQKYPPHICPHRRLGGVSPPLGRPPRNRKIVSFVCSCVRARGGMLGGNRVKTSSVGFPFSLCPREVFPFYLVRCIPFPL
jgi:hypothetical protein